MADDVGFDDWLGRAWDDHVDDPEAVAARLESEGSLRAAGDGDLSALATLAHHVHGEHLGTLEAGRALLARLATHGLAGDTTRASCRRLDASLRLTAAATGAGAAVPGATDPRAGLGASDRVRVTALAAGNLALRDTARSGALLREALEAARRSGLADDDPAVRALAVTGNNLASTLEELPARSPEQVELMVLAAATAREAWGRAGSWLETERAEYRMAKTWLAAGDASLASEHARACLAIVQANGELPLEAFFAWEALARCAAARRDVAGQAQALASARAAFDELDAGDRSWVQPSLAALASATGS